MLGHFGITQILTEYGVLLSSRVQIMRILGQISGIFALFETIGRAFLILVGGDAVFDAEASIGVGQRAVLTLSMDVAFLAHNSSA